MSSEKVWGSVSVIGASADVHEDQKAREDAGSSQWKQNKLNADTAINVNLLQKKKVNQDSGTPLS